MPQTLTHAVVRIEHDSAWILELDAEHLEAHKVKAHNHYTRQHGSAVRSEHEFFADTCAALEGITEVLVVGSKTALADFRRYVEKHHPSTGKRIVGWETADHPTDAQLVASARQYFLRHDRMTGKAPLG